MDEKLKEKVEEYKMPAFIVKEFVAELGKDRALEVVGRALEKMQIDTARQWAVQLGSNSLEALAKFFRPRAAQSENMKVLEVTDRHIAIKISRCFAAEAFAYLGLPEVCKLYCQSDYAMIKAFNPKMKLVRTKTIAGGDEYCDHIWALED